MQPWYRLPGVNPTITGAIVSTLAAFGGLPPVICWESGGGPRCETIGGSELFCPAHPSPEKSEQMQKVCARIARYFYIDSYAID